MKDKIARDIILILISVTLSTLLTILIIKSSDDNISQIQTQTVTVNSEKPDKININECSKEALEYLTNIGDKLSDRIIKYRPYVDIYELKNVPGIDDKIFNSIKDYVETEGKDVLVDD